MTVHKNQPFSHRVRFALAGLAAAWRYESNFRLQLGALVAVVIALMVLRVEPLWWALVLLTSGMVLSAELVNTALEHLIDHLHPETHPRIAVVKDCAAAAVFLSACTALAVAVALVVHLLQRH
jgi:diacylglycerol kinase (ATP)